MRISLTAISMRDWLLVAALAMSASAAAAQSAPGAVEFHVKPDGGQPFTSSDPSVRPSRQARQAAMGDRRLRARLLAFHKAQARSGRSRRSTRPNLSVRLGEIILRNLMCAICSLRVVYVYARCRSWHGGLSPDPARLEIPVFSV